MVLKIQLCLGWEGVARFSNVTETDPNTFDLLSHLIIQGIAIKSWVLHATNRVKFRRGSCEPILGDPGAVSRAGRKGATKVFKHRRKSPWVPTLTGPFPNGQANAGSRLGTKNALYYCAQWTWEMLNTNSESYQISSLFISE